MKTHVLIRSGVWYISAACGGEECVNACVCANSFPPLRSYLCQQSLRPSDELSSRSGGAGAQCVVGTEKLKPCTGVAPCPCAPKCLWEPDVEVKNGCTLWKTYDKISLRENLPYFSTLFYRVDELRDFLESCESYRFLLSITVGTFMQVCDPRMTYVTVD